MPSFNPSSIFSRSGVTGSVLVASFVLFASASAPAAAGDGISFLWGNATIGSGKLVETQRTVPAFDSVAAADGIYLVLRRGAQQKLTITADDNIAPLVEATVVGSTLKLKMRPRISMRTSNRITINVDYTTLNALTINDGVQADLDAVSGSSFTAKVNDGSKLELSEVSVKDFDITVIDGSNVTISKLVSSAQQRYSVADGARLKVDSAKGERVSIKVQEGASMSLRALDTQALELSVADGGRADIAGIAQQQSFALADAASVDAQKLQGNVAQVRASDGSSLKLGAVKTLNADVQDGSSVRYAGDPAITQRISDGASLKRL